MRHFLAKGRPVIALDRALERIGDIAATPMLKSDTVDLCDAIAVKEALDRLCDRAAPLRLSLMPSASSGTSLVLTMKGARLVPHDAAAFEKVLRANLLAPFTVSADAAARMARMGGGSIIHFSSIAAGGNPGQSGLFRRESRP